MDAIYGITKELLAELMSTYGELQAKFGAREIEAQFAKHLASKGLDRDTWALAHNAWMDRFRADPTGRAEAEFHMMLAQATQRAHFADVRDMSADTCEGISLDQYAQITVAVSRQGADVDAIVRTFGLRDAAHWQAANAAWGAKMGADTTHALTMQYGQLYQKYAGPQFQQEMLAQTADILAQRNQPQDDVREPEVELTPALCLEKMRSPSRDERWKYAGHYAHMADLGNVPDKAAAIRTVTPVLLEMIEQHDEHTTSDAERGITKLWDLDVRTDDVRGAVARCLNRGREKLASLEAAFAPIRDKAVPERVTLQSRIQDYTSLVETMQDYLQRDWTPSSPPPPAPSYAMGGGAPSFTASSPTPAFPPPRASGGFPKWILAPIVLAVVAGGLFFARARSKASPTATAAPSSAQITATPTPPKPAATTTAVTATSAATTAAAPATKPAGGGKAPKKK
jgi:hypothetical protein